MSHPIISVKNIGKKYKLGATLGGRNYKTLRDVLTHAAFSPFRKLSAAFRKEHSTSGSNSSPNNPITQSPNNPNALRSAPCPLPFAEAPPREFWALKDISFDVQQGEVVGIIGANGAGKSTLLKILSEITEPTEGEIRIRGRVASLLEVGTGFHPELSGRENVYMNGAILGMTKAEIDAKFDEIVAFAGVEKFIDTPVKRYSSGMQVRLAFAVAAHLEPEILVVDEVLAVGDMEFQKKCIGQMGKVAERGRTVLFVSHNMAAVKQLCTRGILLKEGRIEKESDIADVVNYYLGSKPQQTASIDLRNYAPRTGNGRVRFQNAKIVSRNEEICQMFSIGDDIMLQFSLKAFQETKRPAFCVVIYTEDRIPLCHMVDTDSGFELSSVNGIATLSITLRDVRFYPGQYYVSLWVGERGGRTTYDKISDCLMFEIIGGGMLTARPLPRSAGLLFLTPEWRRTDLSFDFLQRGGTLKTPGKLG